MWARFVYSHSCVDMNGLHDAARILGRMTDAAVKVTYQTMLRNCKDLDKWAAAHCYEKDARKGLTLRNDWHVAYYRSKFRGKRCYYIRHSAIEYIWLEEGNG